MEICLLLISKVQKKERNSISFFPFLAQTMHRVRPGGVIHLHIWCLQYTGLLAVNTWGKIHCQLFLLDSDVNLAPQTSFPKLRRTLTQAHIPIWHSQNIYLVHHPIRHFFFAPTCLLAQSRRLGVCALSEINYHCVVNHVLHGSTSYTSISFSY